MKLFAFGLGYCARQLYCPLGTVLRLHRGHRARPPPKPRSWPANLLRRSSSAPSMRTPPRGAHSGGRCHSRLDSARYLGRSRAGAVWPPHRLAQAQQDDHLSFDHRRLWRQGTANGSMKSMTLPLLRAFADKASGREILGRDQQGARQKGFHPAACRNIWPRPQRARQSQGRHRQARREARPGVQSHPCRGHRPA